MQSLIATSQTTYKLIATCVDKPANFLTDSIGIQQNFGSQQECLLYVNNLPSILRSNGYVTASVDSVSFDSTSATALVYVGNRYAWSSINTSSIDPLLLDAVGWNFRSIEGKKMDYELVRSLQTRMLDWLENNGYPFAKVYLDSIQMNGNDVYADLKVDKGPLYKIDSIRIFGDAKVSNSFIQRYLDIQNGSIYNKKKLADVSRKIRELGYIEEQKASDLTLLGTGSVLNLYLRPRRSSQVNVLIGFLPNNDQLSSKKLLITGEANLLLRNALGGGETIGLNWQQLQVRSQRLNILYAHPFIFNSPFGIDLGVDMLKMDSSYLNLNLQLGVRYSISPQQLARVFLHRYQAILSTGGVNAAKVIATKRLPEVADVSTTNIGVEYQLNKTNYRLNPRSGFETLFSVTAGKKKVKKNNEIVGLQDPSDP
jgi:outer membrane protein assembly factor BamA